MIGQKLCLKLLPGDKFLNESELIAVIEAGDNGNSYDDIASGADKFFEIFQYSPVVPTGAPDM